VLGHFGLDLTGPNGGVVRIDDIVIEDITSAFLRDIVDAVDVRDYGALGDGSTDDSAAFAAADADADGRVVVVPEGSYRLDDHVTLDNPVRFTGTVSMPAGKRLVLRRNFDLPAYIAAFGDEVTAFEKAMQALLNNNDHDNLDLGGRRVNITRPIDIAAAVVSPDSYEIRRVVANGEFYVEDGPAWDAGSASSSAKYNANNPFQLTDVANAANIEPGSLISGNGVGREVYVTSVDVPGAVVNLSQPLWDAPGNQTYSFTRFRYVLDFSGFSKLSRFTLDNIDFKLNGFASGVLLPPLGSNFTLRDCFFTKPRDRGITSHGKGCQNLNIDRCQFISNEQPVPATDRTSVAFNVNQNDPKVRDSRFQKMGTTMVLAGSGNLIVGNHWFQGDDVTDSPRVAAVVLTNTNCKTIITGNYLDNSFVLWANEHDPAPEFANEYSFGGLSITGNIFTMNDAASYSPWIVVKPHGPNHYIHGFNVTGNVFKSLNGNLDRVEMLDDSIAAMDFSRFRNITFAANTFNGVDQPTINPVTLEFTQNTASKTWTLDPGAYLPFGSFSRVVASVVPRGELKNGSGDTVHDMPSVTPLDGSASNRVKLGWAVNTEGTVVVTVRCDNGY
jgi:hypothetical protein